MLYFNINYLPSFNFNFVRVSQVLSLLNFISTKERVESVNFVIERTLMNEMWIILDGVKEGSVSTRNLLLFLFAVMGMNVNVPTIENAFTVQQSMQLD